MPSPAGLIAGVLCATLASGACVAFLDERLRKEIRRRWLPIVALVVLTAVWRLPSSVGWFHGLEYEDAYVYTVSARQLFEGGQLDGGAYLTTVCGIGSIETCHSTETFSGHYLGYPVALAGLAHVIGFVPHIGNIAALGSALVLVVVVFLATLVLTSSSAAAFLSGLAFATTPMFAVHGVASFAEPISAVAVAVPLLAYLLASTPVGGAGKAVGVARWVCVAAGFVFAVAVKRENLIVPLVCLGVEAVRAARLGRVSRGAWWRGLGLVLAVVFGAMVTGIQASVASEIGEYGRFPFGLEVFLDVGPAFLEGYLDIRWYAATALAAVVGIVAATRLDMAARFVVLLTMAYLVLYTTHVRSYYQLVLGDVQPYDSLRYSANLMGLLSVLAGIGVGSLWDWVNRTWGHGRLVRAAALLLVVGYGASTYVLTENLKTEMSAAERTARVEPALAALEAAHELGEGTYVLTFEPLLAQMYGEAGQRVLDVVALDGATKERVDRDAEYVYLDQATYRSPADRIRYASQLELLGGKAKRLLRREFEFALWAVEFDEE